LTRPLCGYLTARWSWKEMKILALRWLILTASITIAAYLLNGIHVDGFFSALLAAAILGILNTFFKPILVLLTLPINILTLGLFTFVINALLLKMASGVISGFRVESFWAAIFGSVIISVVNWILGGLIKGNGGDGGGAQGPYIDLNQKGDDRWE
jgi:putative membrane protein